MTLKCSRNAGIRSWNPQISGFSCKYILDMNKLESGDIVDQELTFDLTEILSRSNTEKQLQAAEKNIEYIVDWKDQS